MQLFYAPEIELPLHTLSEEESKHCVRVLRLGVGEPLVLTDGRGSLYHGRIADDRPKRCTVRIERVEERFEPLPYRLAMAVAPTKNADRYEWFLEKATEVGVSEIVPLESEHSERRVFKPERSEKVITAAMKQSLKAYRPLLHPLTPFRDLVAAPFEGRRFIAHRFAGPQHGGQALPARRAAARRSGAASDRPRRRLFACGDRGGLSGGLRGDHPRHAAAAHRDGRRRRHDDGFRRERPCGREAGITAKEAGIAEGGGRHSGSKGPVLRRIGPMYLEIRNDRE